MHKELSLAELRELPEKTLFSKVELDYVQHGYDDYGFARRIPVMKRLTGVYFKGENIGESEFFYVNLESDNPWFRPSVALDSGSKYVVLVGDSDIYPVWYQTARSEGRL